MSTSSHIYGIFLALEGGAIGPRWMCYLQLLTLKQPMKFPDHISVFHKLRSDPSSSSDPTSFILDVLILSELHQRPAARCEEDIVIYDYRAGKKAPMSGFVREGFEKIWGEQEVEKRKAVARIEEIEGMLRKLERESWDNEGAVEDMGSR